MRRPLTPPLTALLWCQEVTRAHSQTFYLGSRLYTPQQRQAVWAVYAACRVGDDLVDEDSSGYRRAALETWWTQVQAAFAGEAGDTPMQQALCWAAGHYPVPLSAFAELYEGFLMDVALDRGEFQYRTLDELLLYCRRVAGVVGFMIAPIGGYRGGETTLAAALALGQAMQLTNILRDVGEDLRRGRLYLPADQLAAFGVSVMDLHAGRITPDYLELLRSLSALAREKYQEGQRGIPQLRGRARIGVSYSARLYAAILDEIERAGGDNLSRRAYVSGKRKAWLAWLEFLAYSPPEEWCPIHLVRAQYQKLRGARS